MGELVIFAMTFAFFMTGCGRSAPSQGSGPSPLLVPEGLGVPSVTVRGEMLWRPPLVEGSDGDVSLEGLTYLATAVDTAFTDLEGRKVRSEWFGDRTADSFATPSHVVSVVLAEQVAGTREFIRADNTKRLQMVHDVLQTLGSKKDGAFRGVTSPSKALGIAQITPSTYASLLDRYPGAELPADATMGREIHSHSLRATILHGDVVWWKFVKDTGHRDSIIGDSGALHVLLAGGYNGNVGNVDRALHKCKRDWLEPECGVLPEENRLYILKYRWLHSLLTDEEFRKDVALKASS